VLVVARRTACGPASAPSRTASSLPASCRSDVTPSRPGRGSPPPECERFAKSLGGTLRSSARQRRTPFVDQALETPGIDLLGLDLERVARLGAAERDVVPEGAAQPRNVRRQGRRARRRASMPELIRKAVAENAPPRLEQEQREQRALTRTPDVDRGPVAQDLDGAQQAELDGCRGTRHGQSIAECGSD
jgi:hypothetical protein